MLEDERLEVWIAQELRSTGTVAERLQHAERRHHERVVRSDELAESSFRTPVAEEVDEGVGPGLDRLDGELVTGGVDDCVPCPPGAVAAKPAEYRSARCGTASRCSVRMRRANRGSPSMSSSTVTPKHSAWRSWSSDQVCVWQSMSPGSNV